MRCETCQSEATVHIEIVNWHFCASCAAKIDARLPCGEGRDNLKYYFMNTKDLFPIVDQISRYELKQLGTGRPPWRARQRSVRAVWTGEKRPPKRGEWYLSGAIVEAYRAPNDLSTPFHIARLVLDPKRD